MKDECLLILLVVAIYSYVLKELPRKGLSVDLFHYIVHMYLQLAFNCFCLNKCYLHGSRNAWKCFSPSFSSCYLSRFLKMVFLS